MVEKIWERYFQGQKTQDRDELIVHYLYLVKYVVGRVGANFPSHVKLDDLYSSGVEGLIRAVERYDANRKAKFESYANLLIRGSIIDELRRLDWIPRSVHLKNNKLSLAQSELQLKLGREPTDEELAGHLEITIHELEELMSIVKPVILMPLNADNDQMGEENSPLSERIADEKAKTGGEIAEENESIAFLERALEALSQQERKVLTLYYYEELMLKEIGKKLGVSESRVSQIHTQALLKLKTQLHNRI